MFLSRLHSTRTFETACSKEHGIAPHKPILLLAVLDEIQNGAYQDNLITITPELVASFRHYWQALVTSDYWIERMNIPFRYLYQDGFWHFRRNGEEVRPEDKPYSLLQLSHDFDGIFLSQDLWQLLQEPSAVNALWAHLLQSYFGLPPTTVSRPNTHNLLDYEAEKLKAEAQSKFRIRKLRENSGDNGYYIRHALFPRVVKTMYNNACAVCGLAVHTEQSGGIVDAAHILPFSEFHYDHPRNGIALCKNHHWGFDAGWFGISDDYKILISPHLLNGLGYAMAGKAIQLPSDAVHAPAQAALAWHRDNKFLK